MEIEDYTEWFNRLQYTEKWVRNDFVAFMAYLRKTYSDEKREIFANVDDKVLEDLYNLDPVLWKILAKEYCNYAIGSFQFTLCDVIVVRLRLIFDHGDIAEKTNAALAAAHLGHHHSRWSVMNHVIKMCDESLSSDVAQRIVTEIRINERHRDFFRCINQMDCSVSMYHPLIAEEIKQYMINNKLISPN